LASEWDGLEAAYRAQEEVSYYISSVLVVVCRCVWCVYRCILTHTPHTHTHTHAHTHTYIHAHTHTHTYRLVQ
jgi:hypothetical protein